MKRDLNELLGNLTNYQKYGPDASVTGITDDSRVVSKGDLFVAISGLTHDAHKFIPSAIKKGVAAVAGEHNPKKEWLKKIAYIKVANSRLALSILASAWYKFPSEKLKVIGVTGTDGKTTTSNIIYWILAEAKNKTGLISTINAKIGKKEFDTGLHVTNPEPLALQDFLGKMVAENCKYAVLEVTSHGLEQERVAGVVFHIGVLTNITHEHLDYHKNFRSYLAAKSKLFRKVNYAILNKDDPSYKKVRPFIPSKTKVITYGIKSSADYNGENIQQLATGTLFTLIAEGKRITIKTNLLGDYNVLNCLAAIAVARTLNITWKVILKAISTFKTPTGRLEEIKSNKNFKIYIDFAHTPNSLTEVLNLLKKKTKGKLIAILGSAGERDIKKRALMGDISSRIADISIFTAEDPRSEGVNDIIAEMVVGAKKSGAKEAKIGQIDKIIKGNQHLFIRIPERGKAISGVIAKLARKGDIVVICGKGHEKSMAYNDVEYPWSDHQAVKTALRGGIKKIIRK